MFCKKLHEFKLFDIDSLNMLADKKKITGMRLHSKLTNISNFC